MSDTQDQSEVIAFLADPETHGGAEVERIDTHSAIVFLAGDRAWKLKRAVRFPFLDFSTLVKRDAYCHREVTLNRRTAPTLYRAALPVTREPDGLAMDGNGPPVDWVVSMNRFDGDTLFDRMALAGRLDEGLMNALADAIAAFHRDAAEPRRDKGGTEAMRWVAEDNFTELSDFGDVFDPADVKDLAQRSRAVLDAVGGLLDFRRRDGLVRHCHGDLHLQNICLVDGKPTLFDCIEFNDDIACVDVLYDLAYLLMDLMHRDRRDFANLVLNRYLSRTGDTGGLPALALFLSCRAAVRAKVAGIARRNLSDADRARALAEDARRLLGLARRCLDPVPPILVAVGGAPGTGKSTLARSIAPAFGAGCGAIQLRTDVVRKQMLGVDILERLPESAYDAATTERTYVRMIEEARAILAAGHSVIADATFTGPAFRKRIESLARESDTPFAGLWLDAPAAVREARVAGRSGDASDATVELIRRRPEWSGTPAGWHRLDARSRLDTLAEASIEAIRTETGR